MIDSSMQMAFRHLLKEWEKYQNEVSVPVSSSRELCTVPGEVACRIVSSEVVVTNYVTTAEEEKELSEMGKKEEQLVEEIATLERRFRLHRQEIIELDLTLQSKFPKEVAELQNKMKDLEEEIQKQNKELRDEEEKLGFSGGAQFDQEAEPQKKKKGGKGGKKTKKLRDTFRRIANKTHPDKTKDPELHKLFILAKNAYWDENLP